MVAAVLETLIFLGWNRARREWRTGSISLFTPRVEMGTIPPRGLSWHELAAMVWHLPGRLQRAFVGGSRKEAISKEGNRAAGRSGRKGSPEARSALACESPSRRPVWPLD
jgi:hypothetical protein